MNTLQSANRRFGTDVSNIQQDKLVKTPVKKSALTKQIKPLEVNFDVDDVIDKFQRDLALTTALATSPKAETTQKISRPDISFYYDREFLLLFKDLESCKEKIEGLIEEVTPGYRPPILPEDISRMEHFGNYNGRMRKSASATRPSHRRSNSLHIDIPFDGITTPSGGAVFVNFKLDDDKPSDYNQHGAGLQIEIDGPSSPPVSRTERVPKNFSKSAPVTPMASAPMFDPFGDLQSITPFNLSLEWRPKKTPKKVKPRESDVRRLAARQKQIDIGMNTVGYQRFCEAVPVDKRTKEHPKIPDIHQVCSKRSWDGQVRKWRRMLHDYDPESGTRDEQDDEDLGSDNEADEESNEAHCSNVSKDEEESSHSIVETL